MDNWLFATTRSQAAALEAHMELHRWFPNDQHYDAEYTNKTEFGIHVTTPLRQLQTAVDTPAEERTTNPSYIAADIRYMHEQLANIMRYIRLVRANYGTTLPTRDDDCRCRSCAPARWRAEWL